MSSVLDETFDVEPEPEPTTTAPTSIVAYAHVVEPQTPADKQEEDLEKARTTFHALLDKGTVAMDDILRVAQDSEHPRAYEVAAQMLKTMSDITKDLVALQKSKKELERVSATPIGKQQNNFFIGTTNEVLKEIAKQAKIASAEVIETHK
jgi:hypothetical protein